MKAPIDIQKLRKKRQRNARIRQLSIIGLIFLGIFAALYLNDMFVRRNITSQIGGIVDSVGGEGFPTNLPSGKVKEIDNIGKNLIILKDSNLYMYNNKGKQIKNFQQMNERTLVETNGDRMLFYDTGGRTAIVHSAVNELYKIDMNDNILFAEIGNSGEVAVVSSPPNYVAELRVFSSTKPEQIFYHTFSDRLISLVALSPKSKKIAVSTFRSDGGVLDFNLLIYPLDKKVEPLEISLGDRVLLDINYYNEDTIMLLTDKDCLIFNPNNGKLVGSYSFLEDTELISFRKKENHLLVLSKDINNRDYVLNIINPQGTSLSTMRIGQKPLDFDFGENSIYVLKGDAVEEYNYAMSLVKSHGVSGVERIYLIDSDLYLIYKNEIDIFAKTQEEQ